MSNIKEVEWTIGFDFTEEMCYPTNTGEFKNKLDESVRVWNNKEEAKIFAKDKCGKYGWKLIPTTFEVVEESNDSN